MAIPWQLILQAVAAQQSGGGSDGPRNHPPPPMAPGSPPFNPNAADPRRGMGKVAGGGLLSQIMGQARPGQVAGSGGGQPATVPPPDAPRTPPRPDPGSEPSERQPFLARPGVRGVVSGLSALGEGRGLFGAIDQGTQAFQGAKSRSAFNRYLDRQIESEQSREGGADQERLDALMSARHGGRYLPQQRPGVEESLGRAVFQDRLVRDRERAREERKAARRSEDPVVQERQMRAKVMLKIAKGEELTEAEQRYLAEVQRLDPFDRILRGMEDGGGGSPAAGQGGGGGDPLRQLEELYPTP